MQALILGGFLGSGKTTILMRIASSYIERGKKIAVIVNEIGDIGVDGKTLTSDGYNTTELAEGCVCCTLSDTLQVSVSNIIRDLRPDILLIEPTGLAIPSKVKEAMDGINVKSITIGVMDANRISIFIEKKPDFVAEQLKGSDIILMNKIDIGVEEKMKAAVDWLHSTVGDVTVHRISALTGEGVDKITELIPDE